MRQEMHGRLARLEHRPIEKYRWMKHVPWFKLAILGMVALLVLTGHLTVPELKAWLLKRVNEF